MHVDVIAGRQFNQTVNIIIRNFMTKYVNPPCKVINHLPRRSLQIMSECEEEVGTRSPFGGSVASDDRELAIDEGVPESSVIPNLQSDPIQMWSSKKGGVRQFVYSFKIANDFFTLLLLLHLKYLIIAPVLACCEF